MRYRLLDGDIKILVDRERNRLLIVEMNRKRDRDRRDRVRKTRQRHEIDKQVRRPKDRLLERKMQTDSQIDKQTEK